MFLVEIIPDFWFGDNDISPKFIKEKDIKYIINCQEDLDFYGKSKEYIDSIKNEMMRKEINKLYKYLMQMTHHIKSNITQSEPILVMGIKKAYLLILGYLIRYGHMSLDKALFAINTKMPRKIILSMNDRLGMIYFQKEIANLINN